MIGPCEQFASRLPKTEIKQDLRTGENMSLSRKHKQISWIVLAGSSLACAETTHPQQAITAPPEDGHVALEEVVVTATKREARLIDTPEAVSVLSAKTIENLNVQSFQDYASLVPNLNQAGGIGAGSGTIILRGLNTGPQSLTNTTSVYLGETPFTPNGSFAIGAFQTPDPDLVDVERVEVLKGPQGTLYGASSLGGLIRIIPKEPNVDATGLSGDVRMGTSFAQGGDYGYDVRGSLYGPIIPGELAFGISGFKRQDPGFITNVATGANHLGRDHADGGSLSLAYRPISDLTIKARVLLENENQVGQIFQENVQGTGTPQFGERSQSFADNQSIEPEYRLYELTADWKSSAGTLTAALSHTYTSVTQTTDYTPSYGVLLDIYYPILNLGTPPAGAKIVGNYAFVTSADNVELRFASVRTGQFEFLAGAFFTYQDSHYPLVYTAENADGTPLPAPVDNIATQGVKNTFQEEAAFGNATYYITDSLDITGGVRYTKDKQGGLITVDGLLSAPPVQLSSDDNKTLYQGTLRWRPSHDLTFYARTATGYRPGGPENNPAASIHSFAPDTVTDYELGAKGSLFQNRLTFDADVYYMDWKDVQLNSLLDGITVVANGGEAHVKGVELQSAYAATDALTVGGAFGYNNAVLTSVGTAEAATIGARDGDRLPASPRVTFSAYGDYRIRLTDALTGALGTTVRYQGDQVAGFSQDPLNIPYKVPGYTTLDLRTSLSWSRYTVRAIVSNVTDRNGYTGYQTSKILESQTTPSEAFLIRPRTFTLTIGAEF
jgi:iron complex outermembrane receptor protein